ncbi:MAG TPA: hypothetical protein VJ964_09415 [Balneolaceae bacterium]|nr:hypothetical protein [Balneolaceae bacterium]
MEPSLGTKIFWMISIGMVIGYIGFFIYRKGLNLIPSVLTSIFGAVSGGLVAIFLGFNVPLGFAWLGGIAVLFITNVFLQGGEETHIKETTSS